MLNFNIFIMRYIKLFVAALAVGSIAISCNKDEVLHPEVGDVKVSFSYLQELDDDGKERPNGSVYELELATTTLITLDVETEEKDDKKGALIGIEIEDPVILDAEGNQIEVTEANFVLTAEELYLPAYDAVKHGDNMPSKSFEIRLSEKSQVKYSKVTFVAKLTGKNAGSKNEMQVILK